MAFALRQPVRRPATRETTSQDAAADQPDRRVGRGRVAAARGAWAVGSVMLALARLVRLVASIAALVIIAAIVLRVLDANASNAIVSDIHDAGKALIGPFANVFSIRNAKLGIAVNWGLAAVVYLIVGNLIARLIARGAPTGVHPAQPVT